MAKKFLGKVVAGVALGGASLLIGAPGIALAEAPPKEAEEVNKIFTYPEWVKAGHKVKIIEICDEAQDAPWAWTEITGEVELVPKKHGDKWYEEEGSWGEEENGSWGGENGAAEEEGGWGGSAKDDAKKDDHKKDPKKDAEEAAAADEGKKDKDHKKDEKDEKFVYYATVKIPWDTTPGHYELVGQCAEGELKVAPKGWVHGGDGGSAGSNTALATSGAGMLGAAALGGIMLMRRRTNGTLA